MIISPIKTENCNVHSGKGITLEGISKRYPFKQTVKNANFSHGDIWALRDVSFEVREGEIFGIIGRNGAGKTTLLNIIAGVLSPSCGRVNSQGRVLGLFNLGVGFQDELSGRENIFLNGSILGASKDELAKRLDSIVEFSELGEFIDMPLGSYSQGMRLRLGFSILVNLEFDTLVIDEVLVVGDALFQSKCFQRLMDFRRQGKTMVITNQSVDLIERLCDRVALLDHGKLLICGSALEGVSRYRCLLNEERFFVGPSQMNNAWVETTKKWADNLEDWGNKIGSKEVVIDSVEMTNVFKQKCKTIKSGSFLRIRVNFTARDDVKQPHFGVAIFRKDGVYCYGPNTDFEDFLVPVLKKGRGYFVLDFHRVILAPGEYRVSVAIWDKNETLAYDYHNGCYEFLVNGYNNSGQELLKIPFDSGYGGIKGLLGIVRRGNIGSPDLNLLSDKWGCILGENAANIKSMKLLDAQAKEKNVFVTNEPVSLEVKLSEPAVYTKDICLWAGIFRDDRVYCQGLAIPVGKNTSFTVRFNSFPLLPGNYLLSAGLWDKKKHGFISCHHGRHSFKMVFNRPDHGTVYLNHAWIIGGYGYGNN